MILKIITCFAFVKHFASILLTKMLVLALFVETAYAKCVFFSFLFFFFFFFFFTFFVSMIFLLYILASDIPRVDAFVFLIASLFE